ncbi:MAG: GNAT family N-acetyltransferase [Chloroflexota bacterium]
MDETAIRQVRSFNRTVGERIGALQDRFLGRARPMSEARTLWEIGADGIEVRTLRTRLSLDSGYASRLLRSLEGQGLVKVEASPDDGRVRRVHLTEAGLAERAELDRRSDDVARGFLAPLSENQRVRLVAAMTEVERLLTAAAIELQLEDPTTPASRWCVQQYFAELGTRFEAGFDPSLSIPADAHELTPPAGAFLVARLRGEAVGCGAIKFHEDAPAEVKRMWVAAEARGLGLGRRLLLALEQRARQSGVRVLHLETNRALAEAISLYRASSYQEVPAFNDEPYAHHWFEKHLSDAE